MQYFQCELSQGTGRTRAYIEERGAILGKDVEIKDEGFEGRWTVIQVADKGIDETVLKEKQSMDRNAFGSISVKR